MFAYNTVDCSLSAIDCMCKQSCVLMSPWQVQKEEECQRYCHQGRFHAGTYMWVLILYLKQNMLFKVTYFTVYCKIIKPTIIAGLSFLQKYSDLSLKETSPEDAAQQLGHCVSVLPANNGIFFRVKASLFSGTFASDHSIVPWKHGWGRGLGCVEWTALQAYILAKWSLYVMLTPVHIDCTMLFNLWRWSQNKWQSGYMGLCMWCVEHDMSVYPLQLNANK